MTTIHIQHRVADYAAWKKSFDSDPLGRAKNGVTRHTVYRPLDRPDEIVVQLEFDSLDRAERFLAALKTMWQRVGMQIGLRRVRRRAGAAVRARRARRVPGLAPGGERPLAHLVRTSLISAAAPPARARMK
jgi:hypothetical protein